MKDIHKSRPLDQYAIIPNSVIQNRKISGIGRAVLCYLLSLPEVWEVQVDHIRAEFSLGRDKMRKVFKELEDHGHVRLATIRVEECGSFAGKRWQVFAVPSENPDFHGPPENPTVGESGGVYKGNTRDKQNMTEETKETSSLEDAMLDEEEIEPTWKPDKRTKAQKLKTIRPPADYPSEREVNEFAEKECEVILAYRDIYLDLCRNKWHHWSKKYRRWLPIRDWRTYIKTADARIAAN